MHTRPVQRIEERGEQTTLPLLETTWSCSDAYVLDKDAYLRRQARVLCRIRHSGILTTMM